MMGEPKAFASLSSGLLARKGAARPAMRPQGFGQVGSGLDDLGWNDMGFEAPKPALAPVLDDQHDAFGDELSEPALRNPLAALTPVASPVHDQQAEIADRFSSYTEENPDEEDYVDETAELYDPAAIDHNDTDGDDDDAEEEDVRPLIAVKANRPAPVVPIVPVAPVVETEAEEDVLELRVEAPAPVAPTPVAAVAPAPVATAPARARSPRAARGSKAKAAFTLRLDADRHLKLRLACAVTGRSAQQLVTDALDELLAAMPELATMADRAPKQRSKN
jgi:hypothetical protein